MEVFCRTRFVAFHQWKDAPEKYAYLGNVHRHEFHVEVGVHVELSNREVEFHELRKRVDVLTREFLAATKVDERPIDDSCELMASKIGVRLRETWHYKVNYVEVSEDGECGGRVFYD